MSKKWRWGILIGIAVICIIVGSFYDLQLSQSIYSEGNWFGKVMAAFGATPVYLGLSACGMGYILFALRKETTTWLKVVLWVLAVGVIGITIYFQNDMLTSRNAFNIEDKWYVGYPIGLLVAGIGCVIGYFLFKNVTDQRALIAMIAMPVVLGCAILSVDIIKRIMCRPRFRFLEDQGMISEFRNWWESGKALKDSLAAYPDVYTSDVLKEEFRSFPSGHTVTTTSLIPFMVFLPQIDKKFEKYEPYMFYGGVIWAIIMAMSRVLIGAHFLTDVAFGMLISAIFGLIADIVLFNNKKSAQANLKEGE